MKRRIYDFGSSAAMVRKSSILGVAAVLLGVGGVAIISGNSAEQAEALTYQTEIDNSFVFDPSVTVSLSSDKLEIKDLAPGSSSDSDDYITLTVATNNSYGYTVSGTAGDGETYTDTSLKHKNGSISDSFTSLATNASVAVGDGDNKAANIEAGYWGYSYNVNKTTWSNYSGLPYFGSGSAAELYSSNTNATSTIDFKIAASSKAAQTAGEYNNVVNFIATVTPAP